MIPHEALLHLCPKEALRRNRMELCLRYPLHQRQWDPAVRSVCLVETRGVVAFYRTRPSV